MTEKKYEHISMNDKVQDVVNHPAFEGFGSLLFPGVITRTDAEHIDLYDSVDRIPFDKLEEFFKQNLR